MRAGREDDSRRIRPGPPVRAIQRGPSKPAGSRSPARLPGPQRAAPPSAQAPRNCCDACGGRTGLRRPWSGENPAPLNPLVPFPAAARLRAVSDSREAQWKVWIAAARPRTLPAAVAPVVVGSALAWRAGAFSAAASLLCLAFALLVQIGANFANDYLSIASMEPTPGSGSARCGRSRRASCRLRR